MDVCTKCGVELVPGDNWSAGQIKNRSKVCRACNSAKGKAWYAANKERATANKEKLSDKPGVSEAKKAYRKRYYAEHKAHHDSVVRKNYLRYRSTPEHKARMMLTWIRKRAEKKNFDFDLDKEFILDKLTHGECEVTGIKFDFKDERKGGARINPFGPSIDRIDSSIGYIKTNCRMVVWIYNVAKQDYSDGEVLQMAQALISKQGGETYEGSSAD